jgi:pyruvate,orthophosphate dikinase
MADQHKYVYRFSEGTREMKDLLGGKGSGLAEMSNLGLPVPTGFTTTTEACRAYMEADEMPEGLMESVTEYLGELEEATGKRLGDSEDPLLLSVRYGAAASMPGMMDTVSNLGLNDTAVEGLAGRTGGERFARDSYRRFIQMFGDIVLGIDQEDFEDALDLDADDLDGLIDTYKRIVEDESERPFPEEPKEQLELAFRAVFDSWNNDSRVAEGEVPLIDAELSDDFEQILG